MRSAEQYGPRLLFWKMWCTIVFLLYPFFFFSQDTVREKNRPIQLRGYIKNMQTASFIDNANSLITGNFIHNRLNFKWDLSERVYVRVEARNRFFFGEQIKMVPGFGGYIETDRGFFDLSHNILDNTSLVLNTTLDRVLLNASGDKWDLAIGRQRINWGINLVWNPNDIFNAFNYFDFDYEERPGSDAIRIQYGTGELSSIELAYKVSEKQHEQTAALMYKSNFRKYDWQSFAGIYFEDIVIGSGWAGSIKNTGFKGEISYFHPYEKASDTSGALSASVSFDRSFEKEYFAMVSYLYNSEGGDFLSGITQLTGMDLSAKNLMPFEHSFFVQVSKSFNPLINGSLAIIISPENTTLIFFPSLAVSLSDDWDIALVSQSFLADVNEVYRSLGNTIYFRLRWSF